MEFHQDYFNFAVVLHLFISNSFILGLFSCRPAAMARFKRDRFTILIINNQTPHTIIKHPLIVLEFQVHCSPEQRCRSVQGDWQRCHQDNPSCSFAHQKASNPPYSYSFLMFTVVFKMHCFWYKAFFVSRLLRHSGNQLRIIHLTRYSP